MSKQINGLSNQFEGFRKEVDTRFSNIEGRFDTLEGKVDALQIQTKENTEILKALQHSAEVNKAEHDKMTNDIVNLKAAK